MSKSPNHPSTSPSVPLCYSSEEARTVLDSLSAHIAIVDERGIILDTNQAWRDFAVRSGMPEDYDSIGDNYIDVCEAAKGEEGANARTVADGIRSVIEGRVDEFLFDYPCHGPDGPHWYYMRAIKMSGDGPLRVVVSHEEITAIKLTEEALRKSETQLTEQKIELEEANIALKVLLKQRENDKTDLEQKVITNVKDMVMPYVEKLKRVNLKSKDKTIVDIIESHLQNIISPMIQNLANASIILTPQEIQVATLVKDGKASKEIADILNVSETTIHFHRKNLRRKFGLSNSQTNLRSYLLSIS
jgi:DNA-binding CsgD family transcriptional regulator